MKVFKFCKVALVTGALAAMMIVPAFAQYKPFEFDLYIDDGNAAHSAINTKDDNEQTAYVYVGKNGGSRIYAVTHKLDVWVSGHWHS